MILKEILNKYFLYSIALLMLVLVYPNESQTTNNYKNYSFKKHIILLSPKGTESFADNSVIEISWEALNIEKVDIEFLNESGKTVDTVANLTGKNKKYIFKRIIDLPRQFKIRISDSNNPSVNDISPFYFEKKSTGITLQKQQSETISSVPALKIMPLGNSITEGYEVPIPTYRNGYRKPLKVKLDNNGLELDFVGSIENGDFIDKQHEGHGGWHAKHWYPNYNYDMNSHLRSFLELNPPDLILLHIGTNDIGEYYDSRNDNTIDTTVADISGLLDTIYTFDPNIKVILAKIINREDKNETTLVNESDTTTAFNNALEIMANIRIANGDNLVLVDMENSLIYPDDLSDGVHPNSVGYNKMSQVWFDAIKTVLPKLSVKVFLEGSYLSNQVMSNELSIAGAIPNNQPFNQSPWNYSGNENVSTIPSNIVDWVLVSLRSDIDKSSTVVSRAGFVKSDGTVVELDGSSPLTFPVAEGNYYIVVEHRNHLSIMSSTKVPIVP